MQKTEIRIKNQTAGWLTQDENGYTYMYDINYLQSVNPEPVSLTLPLRSKPYTDKVMFPFFDGLIPEGWLLEIAENKMMLSI